MQSEISANNAWVESYLNARKYITLLDLLRTESCLQPRNSLYERI
jgi:hypothetical protein